jgi:uncharacterized protein (DUF4415 family)
VRNCARIEFALAVSIAIEMKHANTSHKRIDPAAMQAAIQLRLPPDTLARWKASGPGWQTRMSELLAARAPKRAA